MAPAALPSLAPTLVAPNPASSPKARQGLARQAQGAALLDVMWASVIGALLAAAAVQTLAQAWRTQNQQQLRWEVFWSSQQWLRAVGRQWQQGGSVALVDDATQSASLRESTTPAPRAAGADTVLDLHHALPEGFSHGGCLNYTASTLGDQVSDHVTLRDGTLRCTSHGVTQPTLTDVHSWQVAWATQSGAGWRWQTTPPDGLRVQAIDVCVVRRHPSWQWPRGAHADCAGAQLPPAKEAYVLTRQVFHRPVAPGSL